MKNHFIYQIKFLLSSRKSLCLAYSVIFLWGSSFAQESQVFCQSFSICLGETEPLYCDCNQTTYSGDGVVLMNNVYYFDSNLTGAGEFSIDASCAGGTDNITVTVYSIPEVLINGQNASTSTVCEGISVNLTASGASTYSWSPTYGLDDPDSANPIASPAYSTTYTVIGTNQGGCADQAQFTVVVLPNVVLTIALDEEAICVGDDISGNVTGGYPGFSYFVVEDPGNFASNSSSGNFSFPAVVSGTYSVTATLNNYPCPVVQGISSVEVMQPSDFAILASDNPICAGSSTNLYTISTDNLTYSWSPSSTLNTNTGELVTSTPSVSTTYSVVSTNEGGCISTESIQVNVTEDCCVMNLTPPSYIIDAFSSDWIGVDYTLDQDLVIQSGVDFKIDNCTLKFAAGKGILLLEGADLWVINSELTKMDACPGFWKGITSSRVSSYPSNADINNLRLDFSTIRFAASAITLYTIDSASPNSSLYWAYFRINDCAFINNQVDFYFKGQSPNPNVYTSIFGYVNRTDFLMDNNFPAGFLPAAVKCNISHLNKYTNFTDCEYRNEVKAFLEQNFELIAIQMTNASLGYTSLSVNLDGLNSPSIISGFTRGIHTQGVANVNLVGTDWANWRDVYIRNTGVLTIIDNDFYNLPPEMMTLSLYLNGVFNSITLESGDIIANPPYGLYIDGAGNKFSVRDNLFNTAIQLPNFNQIGAHGMVANNTGDNANRVRRNTFFGMHRALKIQGDNRTADKANGLKYSCNSFTNNLSDIRELNSNVGNPSTFGVPHQQTNTSQGALMDPHNSFTQSSPSCSICGNDDLSNAITSLQGNHYYIRSNGSTDPMDDESTDLPMIFFVVPNAGEDECISTFQSFIVTDNEGSDSNSIQKELAELQFESIFEVYKSMVDGGNTEDLVEAIQGMTYSEALQLYYHMMAESPNVSEEAMLEALKKFELPNALLTQVLSSNPHAAKSGKIAEEMDKRSTPFEDYQRAQINQGLFLFSSKENMELALAGLLAIRGEALIGLFAEIDEDETITNKNLAKLYLLDESIYKNDIYLKVELLVQCGYFEEAKQVCQEALENNSFGTEDKNDLAYRLALLEMEESLQSELTTILSSEQENVLFEVLQSTSACVSSIALNLLIDKGGYSYYEPIFEDDSEERRLEINGSSRVLSGIRIYPNPAKDFIQVCYPDLRIRQIEIVDVLGKLVFTSTISIENTEIIISLLDLPVGLYDIRLIDDHGKTVNNSKFIKQL